ncbi:MAG: L-aspartate oxidase [Elusimicrobia bacterium]|nr:L-aspartate oxidase [Elusimicrobiota bacterium]
MKHSCDFLVIGSGLAGLLSAHKLSALGSVCLLTKKEAAECNSNYAQGGIAAAVGAGDTPESHLADTLKAGAGLCREDIVRLVASEAPARVRELCELGVGFSQKDGAPDLGLEAGHSRRRVLHAGDITGHEVIRALVERCRSDGQVRILENHIAVNLIRDGRGVCCGAYALERATGEVHTFTARATVLATGGAGKVYLYTSNPDVATGDGMAMAWRAGATLANMEFVQFHPTCLYHPRAKSFLISEALRGEGGRLVDRRGRAFMEGYHPAKELAPRDIVARAIDAELKRSGEECVFLDMTHMSAAALRERFPNIYEKCLSFGIDMAAEPIPVVPAAHFFCGGVQTDADAATSIPRLFAVGEAAHTGLHGANRLASNSLLECCVFAHRLCGLLKRRPELWAKPDFAAPQEWNPGRAVQSDEAVVIEQNWDEVRRLMWNYVGIVRSERRLERALNRMQLLNREIEQYYWDFLLTPDLIELRSIAVVATAVIQSAMARRESRGLHYTLDFPEPVDAERKDTMISRYSVPSAAR